MLCMAACAVAADLKLDMARPAPLAAYESKPRALQACEVGSLEIAYSFGYLKLTALAMNATCMLEVSIEGELDATGKPQRFWCDRAVVTQIDWLNDATGKREQPPFKELRAQRGCQARTG